MTGKLTKKARKAPPTKAVATDVAKADTLNVMEVDGKSREHVMAEVTMSSIIRNAATSRTFAAGTLGPIDFTAAVAVMREKAERVKAGDLTEAEITLMAQAVALDSIFTELARRAAVNMGEHMNATETYLRLALKAQGQCRATLETLAEIKNPRAVAFVKQANIAHGPQQVNNGAATGDALAHAHAGKNVIPSNELLGVSDGERLDITTARTASASDKAMATVETLDRAAK